MNSTNKNVLYLSYDGMTDNLGQSQVLPYLCGLSQKNHSITLVSFDKPDLYQKYQSTIQSICEQNNIQWISLAYHKSPAVLSTIWDLWQLKKLVTKLYSQKKYDIVHCRSYLVSLTGLYVKNKFGAKFIFDMRGYWADERVDGNVWNLKNPLFKKIYNYFKAKELEFYQKSDAIVSLTNIAKEDILSIQNIHIPENKISVIPCCADLNLFNYENYTVEEINLTKKSLQIDAQAFVISYLGSLGTWYMANEMLDFFKVVLHKFPEAIFLFITPEPATYIHHLCHSKNIHLKNIRIVKANRAEVPLFASVSNVSLFFITPKFSKRASSPTKQAELMGLGIPIICNHSIGDTSDIVNENNSGIVVTNFNETAYKLVFDKFINSTFSKTKMRTGAKKIYDLTQGIEKYHNLYVNL